MDSSLLVTFISVEKWSSSSWVIQDSSVCHLDVSGRWCLMRLLNRVLREEESHEDRNGWTHDSGFGLVSSTTVGTFGLQGRRCRFSASVGFRNLVDQYWWIPMINISDDAVPITMKWKEKAWNQRKHLLPLIQLVKILAKEITDQGLANDPLRMSSPSAVKTCGKFGRIIINLGSSRSFESSSSAVTQIQMQKC